MRCTSLQPSSAGGTRGGLPQEPSHPSGRCSRQTAGAPTLLACQPSSRGPGRLSHFRWSKAALGGLSGNLKPKA